ncbi:helix-turn-helix transcriptional regulator [Niveispirillum sp. KHB5.9]|uniref:helix-turn-helix transcriptional regulator n=1 Tax=Niveispirillum sp. KHB5.9 TaxID=3400269 RepID=UPI003A893C7E
MTDSPQPRRTGILSDDFLTIEDLMEALQVSRSTVTSMVQSGRLPPPWALSKRVMWLRRSEVEKAFGLSGINPQNQQRGKRLRDVVW